MFPENPPPAPSVEKQTVAESFVTPVISRLITENISSEAINTRSKISREKYWQTKGGHIADQIKTFNDSLQTEITKKIDDEDIREARIAAFTSLKLSDKNLEQKDYSFGKEGDQKSSTLFKQVEDFREIYFNAATDNQTNIDRFIGDIAKGDGCSNADGTVNLPEFKKRLNAIRPLFNTFGINEDTINIPEMAKNFAMKKALESQKDPAVKTAILKAVENQKQTELMGKDKTGIEELLRIQRELDIKAKQPTHEPTTLKSGEGRETELRPAPGEESIGKIIAHHEEAQKKSQIEVKPDMPSPAAESNHRIRVPFIEKYGEGDELAYWDLDKYPGEAKLQQLTNHFISFIKQEQRARGEEVPPEGIVQDNLRRYDLEVFWDTIATAWDALIYPYYEAGSQWERKAGLRLQQVYQATHDPTLELSHAQTIIVGALEKAVGRSSNLGITFLEIPEKLREYDKYSLSEEYRVRINEMIKRKSD